jgi:hypothetical protein
VRQAGEVVVLLAELLPKVRCRHASLFDMLLLMCVACAGRLVRLPAKLRFGTAHATILCSARL